MVKFHNSYVSNLLLWSYIRLVYHRTLYTRSVTSSSKVSLILIPSFTNDIEYLICFFLEPFHAEFSIHYSLTHRKDQRALRERYVPLRNVTGAFGKGIRHFSCSVTTSIASRITRKDYNVVLYRHNMRITVVSE